ncbi:Disease resistance protein (CC-NBS-LRR class) family [Rhynchospora pubera]|uniref:Disease resistance protein (CC-NBS-LRR class) family n=1 Tax=Rhynchospora pubera TaxID=906938 RepID=A0AAV8GS79_9POAL|nr:Disease resistance protein (CC-NBS-LRR class) family [Rhynchospora pubera]
MPKGIGNLKALQVLKWIDIERSHPSVVRELGQLRQLRKLGVANLKTKHYKELSESISQLSSLRSLIIRKLHNEVRRFESEYYQEAPADFLDSVMSSPPEHLRSIEFQGVIGKLPAWVSSLSYLAKVTLWDATLNDDGIVVLQELPNLLVLRLRTDAYVGVKLIFPSVKFPKLKELFVYNLENLRELLFEDGTLPELQTLKITYCKCCIGGIQYLPKLKKLTLHSSVFVENQDEVQKQLKKHPNHPALEYGS